MESKESILKSISIAKRKHQLWLDLAHLKIKGYKIDEQDFSVSSGKCDFSQWMRTYEPILNPYIEFVSLTFPHVQLHNLYDEIVTLVNNKPNSSLLDKLTGKAQRQKDQQHLDIHEKVQRLDDLSAVITDRLDLLEKRLINQDESTFNASHFRTA